jgi:hypothetical protein
LSTLEDHPGNSLISGIARAVQNSLRPVQKKVQRKSAPRRLRKSEGEGKLQSL